MTSGSIRRRGGAAAARRAHNPKVGGSNPSPATKHTSRNPGARPPGFCFAHTCLGLLAGRTIRLLGSRRRATQRVQVPPTGRAARWAADRGSGTRRGSTEMTRTMGCVTEAGLQECRVVVHPQDPSGAVGLYERRSPARAVGLTSGAGPDSGWRHIVQGKTVRHRPTALRGSWRSGPRASLRAAGRTLRRG